MKFIDRVVLALKSELESTSAGVSSLDHLLLLVPTAEAGRRVREELARAMPRGLIAPRVELLNRFLAEEELSQARWTLELCEYLIKERGEKDCDRAITRSLMYLDLWKILSEGALSFEDVDEEGAWETLKGIERDFVRRMASKGLVPDFLKVKRALKNPPIPPEVKKVFILTDFWPLGEKISWPCEVVRLSPTEENIADYRIKGFARASDEAKFVADSYLRIKPEETPDALVLADASMFVDLKGAMEAAGFSLYDPNRQPVIASSLGKLVKRLLTLIRTDSYDVFSALVRGADFRESVTTEDLKTLDELQKLILPDKMSQVGEDFLNKLPEFKHDLRGIREFLKALFANRELSAGSPEDEEFCAAANEINRLFADVDVEGFDEELKIAVFEKALSSLKYQLESDKRNRIKVHGFMDLPFLSEDEVNIVGFIEGAVPETIIQHPLLPDSLRAKLGLTTNQDRFERDKRIFADAVSSREAYHLGVTFHSLDRTGDSVKPSRLVFETEDDDELIHRVERYYRESFGSLSRRDTFSIPDKWRLKLPIPPKYKELKSISPTHLCEYLNCPFNYFLRRVALAETFEDEANELTSRRFGNLIHSALEYWGKGEKVDSDDAEEIYAEFERGIEAFLRRDFGDEIPTIVSLQAESAKSRLKIFASRQAAWRKEGWRLVESEVKLRVTYDHTTLFGTADRIDYNERLGQWCVIDYKTYAKKDRALKTASVQLPIYCAMLELAKNPKLKGATRDNTISCYAVIGAKEEDVLFLPPKNGEDVAEAEKLIRGKLIPGIEKGIFYPPSPENEWTYDFEDYFLVDDLEASIDEQWLNDQKARSL